MRSSIDPGNETVKIRSAKSLASLALAFALLGIVPARAQSTINTGAPAADSDLNSLVVRQLALAAAGDINGLLGMHSATSLAACLSTSYPGVDCLVTGASPYQWYKYTGTPAGYGLVGTINPSTGQISIGLSADTLVTNYPLTSAFSSGTATLGLNYNSSLTVDGSNNLGVNLAHANVFSAAQAADLGSGASEPAASGGVGFDSYGADGAASRFEATAFNNSVSGAAAIFDGRVSLGTRASPSAVTATTLLSSFEGKGFDGLVWTGTGGSFHIYAEGTWGGSSHPGEACMATTLSGATATTDWWCVHNDGGATLGSATGGDEGAGTANLAGALYNNGTAPTGTGAYVRATSPALVTPTLGVALATSLNGLAITTTTGTLTVANGKTATDTSAVGANLLLGAAGGGFSEYGGASACGANNFVTALSTAGATSCGGSTISGVALGGTLYTLTFGAHLTAGAASYNGSAAVTITSDATNANTVSTIVARDSSGNFSAGTITANLTGTAAAVPLSGITGFGSNVEAALANALNGSGGVVGYSGSLGTPTQGVLTNATGLPLASGVAGILPIANGGDNCSSASGTCLDNITGFSSTGFLTRTGAGAYAFQSATNGVTLANIVQDPTAYSLLGNTSSGAANYAPFTIGSLTNKATPATTDILLLQDQAASGALKYCTLAQCIAAVSSGVTTWTAGTGLYGSATTGAVTAASTNIFPGGIQVNGNMDVAQYTTAPPTATTSLVGTYLLDQWELFQESNSSTKFVTNTSSGQATLAADSITEAGYIYDLKISVSTAESGGLGANDQLSIAQPIELSRAYMLAEGTAGAQSLTCGFWSANHLTGTWSGALKNGKPGASNPRSYPFTYTQATADTPQWNTVTIAGDTISTGWNTSTLSNAGLWLVFAVAGGSSELGTAGSWASSDYIGATGQVNSVAATADIARIWGVDCQPGSYAPSSADAPLVMRAYPTEYSLSVRYAWNLTNFSIGSVTGSGSSNNVVGQAVTFLVPMRAAPSIDSGATFTANSGNNGTVAAQNATIWGIQPYNGAGNWSATVSIIFTGMIDARM
jgi:hypothetical protein